MGIAVGNAVDQGEVASSKWVLTVLTVSWSEVKMRKCRRLKKNHLSALVQKAFGSLKLKWIGGEECPNEKIKRFAKLELYSTTNWKSIPRATNKKHHKVKVSCTLENQLLHLQFDCSAQGEHLCSGNLA